MAASPLIAAHEPGELTRLQRFLDARLKSVALWRQLAYLFMEFCLGLRALKGNHRRYVTTLTLHQIIFSGVDAVGVVSVVAVVIGGVVLVQMMTYAPGFEASAFLMGIITSLIITEIAPLFTSLILVGRSGSAVTVELGNMRVKHHHEALAAMGIDLAQFFYVPRIIGLTVAGIMLNGYFIMITFLSWLVISTFHRGSDLGKTITLFAGALHAGDFIISILKGGVLGMTVALVCIHQGLNVKSSATEIPQRASRAIVTAFIVSFVINMVVSIGWYMMR